MFQYENTKHGKRIYTTMSDDEAEQHHLTSPFTT